VSRVAVSIPDEMPAAADRHPPRPVGTLRASQKEATRQRLMDAAMAVFAEQGYAAATVEDIARAAGASTATFYLHFKRKIDVLKHSLAEEGRQVWFVSEPVFAAERPLTRPRILSWCRQLFAYWQQLQLPHQVLGQAVLIEPELRALQTQRLEEGIRFWESLLLELGTERSPRLRAEAALLNAQMYGLFEMWIVHQVELDVEVLAEVATSALWARLSAASAATRTKA
jgi:AcrR family transcriptional regulator